MEQKLITWSVTWNMNEYPLESRMSWSAGDPLAVRIEFFVKGNDSIVWEFARDLLDDAIRDVNGPPRWHGEADVQVSISVGIPTVLRLFLRSPYGMAEFTANADVIRLFLYETYRVSPRGEEILEINDTIEGLLLCT